jgi:NAD(P)H-dependent flavin oxidoreductase YrpB (nitropropane dioxygenase family)
MHTSFTRLVGCQVPLQQAGMPQVATPELAAAVANAGALGMVVPCENTVAMLDRVAALTAGVFGINFLVPFLDLAAMEAAATRAGVVEFFYAAPDAALVTRVHQGGALAAWQVGSADEGCAAVEAGCDFVIAQGIEAGGHLRGTLPLLVLLDELLDRVEIPVIGAGGIGTARAMAATLATGAAGARIGTRFVASEESGAHPAYIDALVRASATEAVVTRAFSVGWPNVPHRVLRSCIDAAGLFEGDVVGEEHLGTSVVPVPRFGIAPPGRTFTGTIEAMSLYAGQSVGAVRRRQPVADIVAELVEGAEQLLQPWRQGGSAPN